jgi:hypothetical protein
MNKQDIAIPGTGRGTERLLIPAAAEATAVDGVYPPRHGENKLTAQRAAVLGRAKAHVFDWRWLISFPTMLGAMLAGASFVVVRVFKVDPDLWWHLKTGELILSTHRWATTDPYSYTSFSAPWMSCEWLGDIFFAAVYRFGGLRGLEALLIVLASAVMLALYGFATLRSGNCKAGFVATAALLVLANPSFNLRPQMLGYLFLILTLIALERFRQGKQRAVWFLPILFLIWINTHGSWIIGLGVIVLCFACGLVDFQTGSLEARRWTKSERLQLETIFMLCLATIPITPYGTELAAYPFKVASAYPVAIASVLEWQMMPFNLLGGKIFLALILAFIFMQIVFRFSWRLFEVLLFLGGVAMACLHLRFVLLFVPFFAPLFATMVARWFPAYDKAKDQYLINFALVAAIAIAIVHYFPSRADMDKRVAERFPVHALAYMREHHVPGPLFNSYGFGGYMIFSGYKTFIDGRGEMFEEVGVFQDYMHITLLKPGAMKVLSGYGIQSCLMEPDEPLSTVLGAMPDWEKVYSDDVSALYVRRDALQARKQAESEMAMAAR